MLALENYMAQVDCADHNQPQKGETVRCISARPATCSAGCSEELTTREQKVLVCKVVVGSSPGGTRQVHGGLQLQGVGVVEAALHMLNFCI